MTAVPRDDAAEEAVVGMAVSLHSAYLLTAGQLRPDDIWTPSLRRLFESCAALGNLDGTDVDTEEQRIAVSAIAARVDLLKVRRLVEERPLMWDRNGTYTSRVLRAAKARAVMSACATVFNRLGGGERLEDVLAEATDLLKGVA